jgi:hypothetical protein
MDSAQRLRRFIARPDGRHPTSQGLANPFKDSIAMFITDLAGATHIMRRRSLFVLWQVRRLINRWVAAAIAHRVYQLRIGWSASRWPYKSTTMSPVGCAQHMSRLPSAGLSSGSGA